MKAGHYFFTISLFALFGCSSAYIPSPKNVPLFEEKGEIQIEIGASTNSLYLTGSYAFSEKYALSVAYSESFSSIFKFSYLRSGTELNFGLIPDPTPNRLFEVSVGRYNLLPESSNRLLEVFAGLGYGMAYDHFWKDNKTRYFQCFVQVNTGKKHEKNKVGWGLRMAYSNFHNQYERCNDECNVVHRYFQTLHFEPMLVLRGREGNLQINFRVGFNLFVPLPISKPKAGLDSYIWISAMLSHFSLGASYRFKI
jgi:hypothetical protein